MGDYLTIYLLMRIEGDPDGECFHYPMDAWEGIPSTHQVKKSVWESHEELPEAEDVARALNEPGEKCYFLTESFAWYILCMPAHAGIGAGSKGDTK